MTNTEFRFEWYQSSSNVVIIIYKKDIDPKNLIVNFGDQSCSVKVIDELERTFNLSHEIDPKSSRYVLSQTKIELHLTKVKFDSWTVLEGTDPMANLKKMAPSQESSIKIYPSSCKSHHDWDKLAKEAESIEDDKDPLNKLFQDIYSKATDETKKAMIKSFTESNGTVLSTNWGEVGAGHVDMKPPDGMEFKNYEI